MLPPISHYLYSNVGELMSPIGGKGPIGSAGPALVCLLVASTLPVESARRQRACLEWVDRQLAPLLDRFRRHRSNCADHGDCWGEDGLWEHGVSHQFTLTVPLLLRVRGVPIGPSNSESAMSPIPSRFRSVASRLKRWLKVRL